MTPAESNRTIGVFSHGGVRNLGDEALLAAVVQNVRKRIPCANIVGFTVNPEDTVERHGIPTFPIRRLQKNKSTPGIGSTAGAGIASPKRSIMDALRETLKQIPGVLVVARTVRKLLRISENLFAEPKFLLESYRRLKNVELLLIAGSQQLSDSYGGAWGFPLTLYKWSLLASLTGSKVAILSVGAGPIKSPLSKFFFRGVLRRASYRSYRDTISSSLVARMGVRGDHPVYPDLVYSLQLPRVEHSSRPTGHVIVGTNPVPFFDGRYWPEANDALYKDYVNKIASFARWLADSGHGILFFPTQARADALTIVDIRQAMNAAGNSASVLSSPPVNNLSDLVSAISRTDLVVANRYHGILISLALGKPVIGIAYHEKSRALLEQVGQGAYVVDSANFEAGDLIARLQSLEANAPSIQKQILEHMVPLRNALDDQYDKIFNLIGISTPVRVPFGEAH